jgi:hypothetical protein
MQKVPDGMGIKGPISPARPFALDQSDSPLVGYPYGGIDLALGRCGCAAVWRDCTEIPGSAANARVAILDPHPRMSVALTRREAEDIAAYINTLAR